jgi:hypothetical protein
MPACQAASHRPPGCRTCHRPPTLRRCCADRRPCLPTVPYGHLMPPRRSPEGDRPG